MRSESIFLNASSMSRGSPTNQVTKFQSPNGRLASSHGGIEQKKESRDLTKVVDLDAPELLDRVAYTTTSNMGNSAVVNARVAAPSLKEQEQQQQVHNNFTNNSTRSEFSTSSLSSKQQQQQPPMSCVHGNLMRSQHKLNPMKYYSVRAVLGEGSMVRIYALAATRMILRTPYESGSAHQLVPDGVRFPHTVFVYSLSRSLLAFANAGLCRKSSKERLGTGWLSPTRLCQETARMLL